MTETERIEKMVRVLDISESQAREILQADKEIDQGKAQPFDLSKEEEKQAKKLANTGTRKVPTVYKLDATDKPKKVNSQKVELVETVQNFLATLEHVTEATILNPDRLISFSSGGNTYELTLVQKRAKK